MLYYEFSQQDYIYQPNKSKQTRTMHGKYADRRVYQHYVHTYSRVPYLDHEIFNITHRSSRIEAVATERANSAREGLKRIEQKSQRLELALKQSREKRENSAKQYEQKQKQIQQTHKQQVKTFWKEYSQQKSLKFSQNQQQKKQLNQLLKSVSTQAQSRRISYRRRY